MSKKLFANHSDRRWLSFVNAGRSRMSFALVSLAATILLAGFSSRAEAADRPPNIVVIFIDDMGYADIGPFGATAYKTPHLDKMAAEGMKFTDFQVSSAVCSASRAALLTGCYHRRIGFQGALGPTAKVGLSAGEMTLAELCKQKDYATAIYGKWHLGHHPKFLPTQHGFDEYFGIPYSNDMWPFHPRFVDLAPDDPLRKKNYPPLPLVEGKQVIDANVVGEEQKMLTTWYTEKAVDFIERNKSKPFFLYVPHSMVHVPLYVSDKFDGKSGAGLYGDVVMEVDWSVGQILESIKANDLDDDTLVIFTSDNGPWLSYGDHAGSSGPLREGKGTMFEGGCREPTVMRWPGKIPAGTACHELSSTIDILPTVAKLIDAPLPDHKIDGKDIRSLMFGESGAQSPHETFFQYYGGGQLQSVRDRQFKLHFPHGYRTMNGREGGRGGYPNSYQQAKIGRELFDLKSDVGETTNVLADHPEVVKRLEAAASDARSDLGDTLKKQKGEGIRPIGRLQPDDELLVWGTQEK